MAEFVEYRAEEWLPELEEMERISLFDAKEIKSIATRRKEFEYKIQRRTKSKEDFLKFIQFELDLHKIIKARRKKRRIETKRSEIDHSQTHRIANLFKQVIFKFQSDVKLWMSFFQFCKEVKFHSLVSQMLVRMLQIHANKPDLWVFASKWELHQCNSVVHARRFLTKGLRHHPSSHQLYKELFKLEIEHITQQKRLVQLKKKKNKQWVPHETAQAIIRGKLLEVVYESAVKAITGVKFRVSLLKIANTKAPLNLRIKIMRSIVKEHLNEELTWHCLAQREFLGQSYDLKQLLGEEEIKVNNKKKKKIKMRERIQNSINVYEEAVTRINTVKMWNYYLGHVIKLNYDKKSLPIFKSKLLKNAMEGAMLAGKLDEKYYLHWIEILRKSKKFEKQLEVLTKGVEQYPKSVAIWHALLRYHFSFGKEDTAMKLFKEAVKDAVPLWKLVVKYLQLKSSPKIENVFEEGIRRGGDVALALKPDYIEWLVKAKGIEEARRIFESPEMQLSPCLELYYKMAELEASQPQISVQNIRKCYEQACSRFGSTDINVWLEYIKFEMRQDVKNVNQIHSRAVKMLLPEKVEDFISEYNKFKTNTAACID